MFRSEEIPSWYVEDYKTLHHDIGLVKRSNGSWDLWFGQDKISELYKDVDYLNIVEGDLVSATEVHSLQVGIVIACLTSWNYLNRTGNPIYTEFGNESYSLLKKNKGVNTRYKIKQFFIDCLNRMRRVYHVESLEVYDVENNPYMYKVIFKVLSVTNTLVDGEFYLNTDSSKNTSILNVSYNHPYTSVSNPLIVECVLGNEYGSYLEGEIIYVYVKTDKDDKFKFYGITEATDDNGSVFITIPPNGLNIDTQIMFVFKGNTLYNPSVSKIIHVQSVAYYIKSEFTYKSLKDEEGNEVKDDNGEVVNVIDKQILYVEDSSKNKLDKDKFKLGELLSDYIYLNDLDLTDYISINDLLDNQREDKNWKLVCSDENSQLIYDDREKNKLYLVPIQDSLVEGTNKPYYKAYEWSDDGLQLTPYNVQLNSDNEDEVHFLIDIGDNGLFEIDFGDGHLYYQVNLMDYEI